MKYNVDLIFNCYEKTYLEVLNKSFIHWVIKQNNFEFANIFVVINNVKNKEWVKVIAEKFKKEWAISDYFRVEDHIDAALKKSGLKKSDISKVTHYIDRALVCSEITKSEYFVHRDSDVYLEKDVNRIKPCIQEMEKNRKILIANPFWRQYNKWYFWFKKNNDFYYAYRFSDQLYLVRKNDLLQDIYKYDHIYTSIFPLYTIGRTFEARIDSYMRNKDRIRLIYRHTSYIHKAWTGSPYPNYSLWQHIKWISVVLFRRTIYRLYYNWITNKYTFLFRKYNIK